jgi:hypothetical protein
MNLKEIKQNKRVELANRLKSLKKIHKGSYLIYIDGDNEFPDLVLLDKKNEVIGRVVSSPSYSTDGIKHEIRYFDNEIKKEVSRN